MQFAAWDRGIGSCISTGDDEAGMQELLGVPEALAVTAVVGFGYPTFDAGAVRGREDRAPLDEAARDGRYEAPLDRFD